MTPNEPVQSSAPHKFDTNLASPQKPQHEHDCDCCHFLGRYNDEESNQPMDLYAHTKGPFPTVIARSGPAGDYMSGMEFSYGRLEPLTEARRRAQAAGLVHYDLGLALMYGTPENPNTYEELKQAIGASKEWEAVLAFEAGNTQTSQTLVNELVDARVEADKGKDGTTRLSACFDVQQRVSLMAQAMRNYDRLQSVDLASNLVDFVWKPVRNFSDIR